MSHYIPYFILLLCLWGFGNSQQISPTSCTLSSGALAPNATSCSNTRDTASCEAIFANPSTTDPKRDPNCVNPDLEDIATECAQTCGLCCETAAYACGNDPASPINCTANARFCNDANWTAVMTQYCPGTCGFCASAPCKDINEGCADMITLCYDVTFNSYMQANCQRTCNFCSSTVVATTASSSSCTDVASNCAANSGLCSNAAYYSLMTQKCGKTCGRCSTASSTCTDSNANCPTWVSNGFCTNSFYTDAEKLSYCGASCSLC